jgi:hypothetical protein
LHGYSLAGAAIEQGMSNPRVSGVDNLDGCPFLVTANNNKGAVMPDIKGSRNKWISWATRHKIISVILAVILLSAIGHAVGGSNTATTSINTPSKSNSMSKPATSNQPVQSNISRATLNSHAAKDLSAGSAFYAQLLQQGQAALGTTQYPNAQAALAEENNPSSAAAKWSKFNSMATSTDYSVPHITQPYNQASNLYASNAPDALSSWMNDMQQTDSDFHAWTQQATKWLDSEITTSQLNTSAQTFQKDLSTARSDITQIK